MMQIPFYSLKSINNSLQDQFNIAIAKSFEVNDFVLGTALYEFEKKFAEYNNCKYCIGVANGYDALVISLMALGIREGDEVILPAHSFIATAFAVSRVGAIPIFIEPDIETYNIDIDKIITCISPRTKAIIPVHLYGLMCDMDKIMEIANHYKLFVIEDFAQSHGAQYKGVLAGSIGHINATSFYPTKNLGAIGDGGAVCTNDFDLYQKVLKLRNYGSIEKYSYEFIGLNSRLDEIQAMYLNIKLQYLDEWNESRNKIAKMYDEGLANINEVILPVSDVNFTHVYHLYTIRTIYRDELSQFLKENGIGTGIHYPIPVHLQKAYADLNFKKGDFLITEEISKTTLSLPLFIGITDLEIEYVIYTIKLFFKKKDYLITSLFLVLSM